MSQFMAWLFADSKPKLAPGIVFCSDDDFAKKNSLIARITKVIRERDTVVFVPMQGFLSSRQKWAIHRDELNALRCEVEAFGDPTVMALFLTAVKGHNSSVKLNEYMMGSFR